MPKVKYCKPVPPPNLLRDMFDRYMKARELSAADLGELLGMTADAVRSKKHRGVWDQKEIRVWCKALGITDPEEVGKAVLNRT